MSGGKFSNPKDTTLIMPAYDPGVKELGIKSSESMLVRMRNELAKYKVVHNKMGINYDTYREHMEGIAPITLNDIKKDKKVRLYLTTTGSTCVLVHDDIYEKLRDISASLTSISFEDNAIVEDEETGKRLYLCRISSEKVRMLKSIETMLAKEAAGEQEVEKPVPDTLMPQQRISLRDFREKLKKGDMVTSSMEGFDIVEFADRVKFVVRQEDDMGELHHYIQAGANEDVFKLYVNANPPTTKNYIFTANFKYKTDFCILCMERPGEY